MSVISFGRWGSKCCPSTLSPQELSRQGKAPYRQHPSAADATSIATLGDIVRQLEDLQDQRDWNFDWQEILNERNSAHESITKGDYTAAVASYCSAVRRLMQALRDSPPEGPSDSTIELG